MKRKFTDINGDSATDDDSIKFQPQRKRKRRRKQIVASPIPSQSDSDIIINDDVNNDHNSQKLSMLHITSHHSNNHKNNDESSVSLTLSDENSDDDEEINNNLKKKRLTSNDKGWSCKMCTFLNENKTTKCEMCDTQRIDDEEEEDEEDKENIIGSDTDGEDELLRDIEIEDNNFNKIRSTKKMRKKKEGNKLQKEISIVDLTQIEDETDKTDKKKHKFVVGKPKNNGSSILNKKKQQRQRKLPIISKKEIKKKSKKQKEEKKDKDKPKMSSITGNRSRSQYYSNLVQKQKQQKQKQQKQQKQQRQRKKSVSPPNKKKSVSPPNKTNKTNKRNKKKNKLTKTESIESVDHIDILNMKQTRSKSVKSKNMENISDDSDCIVIHETNRNTKNTKKSKSKSKATNNGHIQLILDNDRICKQSLQNEQWIDKYAPYNIDDLYLHKKKFNEIDGWFRAAFKSLDNMTSQRLKHGLQHIKSVLFVVGQSGVGKTSAIKCLCNKYNAKLLYYPTLDSNIKPFNQSIWDNDNTHFMTLSNINRRNRNIDIRDETQMDKFDAFLNRSKRFTSLNLNGSKNHNITMNKRQVILIRELPYVGSDEYLYRFRQIVEKMCNTTRNIVIFEITTEFEGTRDDLQIFGGNIRFHPRVTTIRFNPINKTLMKKCLNNILISENLKKYIVNINGLINNIIENEKGDLRNAIQTLQMRLVQLTYSGQIDLKNNDIKTRNNKKRKKNKKSKISSLTDFASENIGGREETLSLFHSLGKVLYAKKEMEPEEAIERSDLDCIKFNDLLFENFGDFFVYNQHFTKTNNKKKNKPKEVDEFGFEIDLFNDEQLGNEQDDVFEKYCNTLNYFGDADICCEYYNKLRFSDTSTDLRSTVNHIQFGSQLYPAIYAASIGARGYLISHDEPPKLKLPQSFGQNKYKKGGGLNQIRGSTHKLVNNLKNELCAGFRDILLPKKMRSSFDMKQHYIKENELTLLRTFMCHPTSLYVDIFPLISNIQTHPIENECNIDRLCVSLIKTSNWYSMKYEWKQFQVSRFDYLQKSIAYKTNDNKHDDDIESDDNELIDEIEEFDD